MSVKTASGDRGRSGWPAAPQGRVRDAPLRELSRWAKPKNYAACVKAARVGALSLTLAVSCMSSSSTSFAEGSGSPFATGSTEGRVEGSSDFEVSDVVREQGGTIRGTLTYAGSCDLVKADLRLSYVRGDRILTGKQVGGVDAHFEIGPLAP